MKFFQQKLQLWKWLEALKGEWLSRFSDRCRWVGCAVAGARELGQHRFFHSRCGIALQAWFDSVLGMLYLKRMGKGEAAWCYKKIFDIFWPFEEILRGFWKGGNAMKCLSCLFGCGKGRWSRVLPSPRGGWDRPVQGLDAESQYRIYIDINIQ